MVVLAQARAAKALDQPKEPLLTYSLMLRPTDMGYLNQLGHGNLSLGLRPLSDEAHPLASATNDSTAVLAVVGAA